MVAKAHQRSNAILRSFVSRDIDLLVRAFSVYVLPLLEYNSVVWSPQSVQDIELVERVQRRFTKRLELEFNIALLGCFLISEVCHMKLG